MCTGVEPVLAALGTTASVVSTVYQLSKSDKTPDPAKQRAEAEAKATQDANARLAQRTRALQAGSLQTGAGLLADQTGNKTTFGG